MLLVPYIRAVMVLGALQIRATMVGHVQRMATVSRVPALMNGRGKSAQQVGYVYCYVLIKGVCQ